MSLVIYSNSWRHDSYTVIKNTPFIRKSPKTNLDRYHVNMEVHAWDGYRKAEVMEGYRRLFFILWHVWVRNDFVRSQEAARSKHRYYDMSGWCKSGVYGNSRFHPHVINVFSDTWIKTCSTMGNTESSPQQQGVTFSCKAPVNTDILKWLSCSSNEWRVLKTSWSWRSPTVGWFHGKQGQPH